MTSKSILLLHLNIYIYILPYLHFFMFRNYSYVYIRRCMLDFKIFFVIDKNSLKCLKNTNDFLNHLKFNNFVNLKFNKLIQSKIDTKKFRIFTNPTSVYLGK